MTSRLRNAVEDTFIFMDTMGAAISVSKSHMYASQGDLRKEKSSTQWGRGLADDRGGKLAHAFTAPTLSADDFVKTAREAIGHDIQHSRLKPDGNTICVECEDERYCDDYPIYLTVPAKYLPGLYAYSISKAMQALLHKADGNNNRHQIGQKVKSPGAQHREARGS